MTSQNQVNKMSDLPCGRLLFEMAVPTMLSMLIQSLYNIVDTVYVGKLGERAITAVTLASPVSFLMLSIFLGTGVGVSSYLSRTLGEDNLDKATNVCSHALFLSVTNVVPFMLFVVFFTERFISLYSEDAVIVEMGVSYLKIILLLSLGQSVGIMLSRMMHAFGDAMFQMTTQTFGCVLNIILDPIFIFGGWSIPAMGVKGAAYATVFSQFMSMVIGIVIIKMKKLPCAVSFRYLKLNVEIIKGIYRVGLPSIISQSIGSVLSVLLNGILISLSSTAVAISGIYGKLMNFVFMPVFGISNSLVAIIGYNYGAKDKKRVMDSFKIALVRSLVIMALGMRMFQIMPDKLLSLFSADENMMRMGIPALKIISLNFCFAAIGIIVSSVFSGVGDGSYSMFTSFSRQILGVLPPAYFLAKTGNVNNVRWCYVFSEFIGLFVAFILFRKTYKTKIKNLQ